MIQIKNIQYTIKNKNFERLKKNFCYFIDIEIREIAIDPHKTPTIITSGKNSKQLISLLADFLVMKPLIIFKIFAFFIYEFSKVIKLSKYLPVKIN